MLYCLAHESIVLVLVCSAHMVHVIVPGQKQDSRSSPDECVFHPSTAEHEGAVRKPND